MSKYDIDAIKQALADKMNIKKLKAKPLKFHTKEHDVMILLPLSYRTQGLPLN